MHTLVKEAALNIFSNHARIVITGFSFSGKSFFCSRLIRKYAHIFEKIVIIGAIFENLDGISNILYDDKFDALTESFSGRILIIYDDSIFKKDRMQKCSEIFARGRHRQISVIFFEAVF